MRSFNCFHILYFFPFLFLCIRNYNNIACHSWNLVFLLCTFTITHRRSLNILKKYLRKKKYNIQQADATIFLNSVVIRQCTNTFSGYPLLLILFTFRPHTGNKYESFIPTELVILMLDFNVSISKVFICM